MVKTQHRTVLNPRVWMPCVTNRVRDAAPPSNCSLVIFTSEEHSEVSHANFFPLLPRGRHMRDITAARSFGHVCFAAGEDLRFCWSLIRCKHNLWERWPRRTLYFSLFVLWRTHKLEKLCIKTTGHLVTHDQFQTWLSTLCVWLIISPSWNKS